MASPVWSSRHLRSRVTHLLRSFSRCKHCVRRLSVPPTHVACSQYLAQQLSAEEYQTVLVNPRYFVKDETVANSMEMSSSQEWDLRRKPALQRGKSVPNQHISRSSHLPEPSLPPKSAPKRPFTSEIERRERRLIAARAFIRKLTFPRLDKAAESVDLRNRNVQKLWKSFANTSFKEAILSKNPLPAAISLSKIDDKRDQRQDKIDENTANLRESMLKRQQAASRKKSELDFQQLLERKRLELRLEQRKEKKSRKIED